MALMGSNLWFSEPYFSTVLEVGRCLSSGSNLTSKDTINPGTELGECCG